jgi:6-phosphogluconate dehydrogenase
MAEQCQIGVTGLAVMGANLARNLARHGFGVAVHNRTSEKTDRFITEFGHEGRFTPAHSPRELVAAIARPRAILVMVKAGKPVDDVIAELEPYLEPGDIVIDGGNSHFTDTQRRTLDLEAKGLRFLGTGVSGGEEGALLGPSIMPGGTRAAYDHVAPILTQIAAQVDGTPCCTYIGPDGAGHYVKMVHNGIEYADMQLIAEAYDLLRHVGGFTAPEMADIFGRWKAGDLDSYLIEITAEVLRKQDAATGEPLVDVIMDTAEQKGTGRWTVQSALELGVPITAIGEAVFARALSSQAHERAEAAKTLWFGPDPYAPAGDQRDRFVDAVRDALYASKIVAYAQGFAQLRAASAEYHWNLKPGDLATIWRGGCIIRAKFLDRLKEAYDRDADLENLMLTPYFSEALQAAHGAWRRVVVEAMQSGVPAPAFASSLAYFDGYRRERGPANLIQGLRDYFGAHTYRRIDRPGTFHTQWSGDGTEVEA